MGITEDTLQNMKNALNLNQALTKATNTITTTTGLVPIDLQAPAKRLYPVNTPIRNSLPRSGGIGLATQWKVITGITGSGYNAMGSVPEGQRTAAMSMAATPKTASYVTIGEESQATFEAINAGKGFEDVAATDSLIALQKLMLKEENHLLGGNTSVALGTPTAPTLSASGTGATLPALTYSVIVVALTYMGRLNSTVSATGVASTLLITGQDGLTYTLKGGSSNKSAATTQAVTLGQTLFASTPAIRGAVAYAWYVGAAGAETLQAITSVNVAAFTVPLTGGMQAATAITADNSANASNLDFDGLLYYAFNSGNTVGYFANLATGTGAQGALTGTPLTASGRGSVSEIDTMFYTMWQNYQISPTVLYMNAQEVLSVTNKVLSGSSGAPLVRFNIDAAGQSPRIAAGAVVGSYFNPFATNGNDTSDSGFEVKIRLHPTMPPGTIFAMAESLPAQYQNSEISNVAEVRARADYYQLNWPIVTRAQQFGVYSEEVLAVYAPLALGVVTNIGSTG